MLLIGSSLPLLLFFLFCVMFWLLLLALGNGLFLDSVQDALVLSIVKDLQLGVTK